MATIRLNCVGAKLSEKNAGTNYYNPSTVSNEYPNYGDYMLLKFDAIPSQYLYRAQSNPQLHLKGYGVEFPTSGGGNTSWRFSYSEADVFDPKTVTYYNYGGYVSFGYDSGTYSANAWAAVESPISEFYTSPTYIGVRASSMAGTYYTVLYGPGNSSNKPYITITISDTDATTTPSASNFKRGFVNRLQNNSFIWALIPSAAVPGTFKQTASVMRWRVAGETVWNEIRGSDTVGLAEVPAGTFPALSDIEWQVETTDNLGHVGTSEIYTITTTDAETTATPTYPINGAAIDETVPQTFRWTTSNPNGTDQTKAEIAWTVVGSGTWSPWVTVAGNVKEYTYPAGTFPAANIQWDVRAYNIDDVAGPWGAATFSTIDTPAVATPVSPVGTVEDASAPITFEWSISNDSGSTPTGSDLQVSADGATWTDQGHVDGAGNTYTVPGNTYTAGERYWRVRAYNRNGTAGDWSAAVSFIAVAAPLTPSVTVNPVPWATVNWQVEGQQAYRITVDGTAYGPYFGETKSWTVPDYLRDGEHTIQVEVQGVYGLWSQPGSATFAVANQPGRPITLEGAFDRDAALSWTAGDAAANYYIYRDGVQIGHATGLSFNDRLALGPHSYRVANRLPDGNYSISNSVTGTMISCTAAIAPLAGGDWIELKLSDRSDREESFTWTQSVSLRHYAGATYPVAELSPYADESGAYDAAFADLPSARAFEALRGQPVILKSRGGNVMIGILATLSKRMTEFYISFGWTLQRMHWRDWIDADG